MIPAQIKRHDYTRKTILKFFLIKMFSVALAFIRYLNIYIERRGGLMVSVPYTRASAPWSSHGRGHSVVFLLCSWARHFTLMVPLSTQVYKWVPATLLLGGNPAKDWMDHPGGGGGCNNTPRRFMLLNRKNTHTHYAGGNRKRRFHSEKASNDFHPHCVVEV